jgi:hypothetical protein
LQELAFVDISKIKDFLELGSYLVAIIGGCTAGLIFLRRNLKAHNAQLDSAISGKWSNEGSVGGILPTHFVDLDLAIKDGITSGILSSRKLDSETHWNNLSVSGKRKGKKVELHVIHVRHGKISELAVIKIQLDKKNLKWLLIQGTADFFPVEIVLWKCGTLSDKWPNE